MKRPNAILRLAVFISLLALPVVGHATLVPISTYSTGIFDEGAAMIVAYDPGTKELFVTNADAVGIDVLDISDPTNPTLLLTVDLSAYGDPTSVDAYAGVVAVAMENGTDPGKVVFLEIVENGGSGPEASLLNVVTVGALPDMLTFTPDGTKVLTANEGEPNDDYDVDPEGSVSIIDISGGVASATVTTADFTAFNGLEEQLREARVRIYGPGASVAQDVEPEYIAISPDSQTAWVTLQENNAIATVDISSALVTQIAGLGNKNHRKKGNGLDASNKDDAINIANWPVKGIYLPDGIAAYQFRGKIYLITANEGDARDYDGFSEEARVRDDEITLGYGLLSSFPGVQKKGNLGRLKITTSPPTGKVTWSGGEFYNQLYCYGARSFSIWNAEGAQVYDSGDDFEQLTAAELPDDFNSTDEENDSFDDRSDDKGPEPEGVVVGEIGGGTYAFIGLERIGGIMMYDVTDPRRPVFVDYVNNRDFSGDPEAGTAGDLSPEGLEFIPAADSPNGYPLLAVANEISGTTTIFQVNVP